MSFLGVRDIPSLTVLGLGTGTGRRTLITCLVPPRADTPRAEDRRCSRRESVNSDPRDTRTEGTILQNSAVPLLTREAINGLAGDLRGRLYLMLFEAQEVPRIQVLLAKLADAKTAERMKSFWAAALDRLKDYASRFLGSRRFAVDSLGRMSIYCS
jgi:hypothetical protein